MLILFDRHNPPTNHPTREWRVEMEEEKKEKRRKIKLLFDHKTIWLPRMFYYSSLFWRLDSTQREMNNINDFNLHLLLLPSEKETHSHPQSTVDSSCASSSFPLHLHTLSLAFARRCGSASPTDVNAAFLRATRLLSPSSLTFLWSLHVSIPIKSEIKWEVLAWFLHLRPRLESGERWIESKQTREKSRKLNKKSEQHNKSSHEFAKKDSWKNPHVGAGFLSRTIITSVLNISYSHSTAQILINTLTPWSCRSCHCLNIFFHIFMMNLFIWRVDVGVFEGVGRNVKLEVHRGSTSHFSRLN